MDDDELIASLAGGDDVALRQLFDRHAPWLAARLRKALPPDDVEDVLQETFLAVWKNAGTYQPRGASAAWLWVIARNQAALLLRKRGPATQALLDEGRPVAEVAAVGIAYSYGPGLDPAWELSVSIPVSDRLVLLTRAVAVFAVNAVLGLIASAATLGTHAATGPLHLNTVQLAFAWLLPMTTACALALAVAVAVRSAIAGAGAGVGAWLVFVLAHSAAGRLSAAALTSAVTDANLYLPYLAVAACCAVIVLFATRPQRGPL